MLNTIHYPLPQVTHDEGGSTFELQLLDHCDQLMTDEYIMISRRESRRRRNGRTSSILVLGMHHKH
jgi:hypothetical protein